MSQVRKTMVNTILVVLAVLTVLFVVGCGGSNDGGPHAQRIQTKTVSNAVVGDPYGYADGNWNWPDPTRKWIIRGTAETPEFGLADWYLPANGPTHSVPWWTVQTTAGGVLMVATPPDNGLYNGSFLNDVFLAWEPVKNRPIVNVELDVLELSAAKGRVTIGVSMRYPDKTQVYLEQQVVVTGNWQTCADPHYTVCLQNITYFAPPFNGAIDVRALMLQSPGMTPELVDTLSIAGIYIGSEIFGQGRATVLLKSYSVREQI